MNGPVQLDTLGETIIVGAIVVFKFEIPELAPIEVERSSSGSQPPAELQIVPEAQQPFMQQLVPTPVIRLKLWGKFVLNSRTGATKIVLPVWGLAACIAVGVRSTSILTPILVWSARTARSKKRSLNIFTQEAENEKDLPHGRLRETHYCLWASVTIKRLRSGKKYEENARVEGNRASLKLEKNNIMYSWSHGLPYPGFTQCP